MDTWNELSESLPIIRPSYEVHNSIGFSDFQARPHCSLSA